MQSISSKGMMTMSWLKRGKRPPSIGATLAELMGGDINPLDDAVTGCIARVQFIHATLQDAQWLAEKNGVEVGDSFNYTISGFPPGISDPIKIAHGLMVRANMYGLACTDTKLDGSEVTFRREA